MNVQKIQAIGQELARLVRHYHGGPKRELLIDPALYALLRATGRTVERQYHAHLPGAKRPARIDFRMKGPNPVLIEFAVRGPGGKGQLYGSQNRKELHKLTRFSNNSAKLRALLLVDLYQQPHDISLLKASYDKINAGKGRFKRHPVKVIYAHADTTSAFRWDPFKRKA